MIGANVRSTVSFGTCELWRNQYVVDANPEDASALAGIGR